MSKEKWSKIVWGIIILCFVILTIIGQIKIKEQNSVLTTVVPRSDVPNVIENYNLNIEEKYKKLSGYVYEVAEDHIMIKDESDNMHEINVIELMNYRTREPMKISEIKFGDYYKNGEIIRNVSGAELKKELLLNLARAFNSSKLSTTVSRLKRLKQYDGYVTFKVSICDQNFGLFGRENPELFNIELIANEQTVLYARTNLVTIYNLQKSVRDKTFYLEIDENTLNDEMPVVRSFEIAD